MGMVAVPVIKLPSMLGAAPVRRNAFAGVCAVMRGA